MDASFTKAEAALLLPAATHPSRRANEVEALRLAAVAAGNAAIGGGLRRLGGSIAAAAAAALRAVASLPLQIQTYNALRRLSDRELNDIGMTRFDIDRVFTQRPANDAGERPASRAA